MKFVLFCLFFFKVLFLLSLNPGVTKADPCAALSCPKYARCVATFDGASASCHCPESCPRYEQFRVHTSILNKTTELCLYNYVFVLVRNVIFMPTVCYFTVKMICQKQLSSAGQTAWIICQRYVTCYVSSCSNVVVGSTS